MLSGPAGAPAAAQGPPQGLAATLDGLARAHAADPRVAGVAVGVVHRGDTLLLAGYGLADLEWDVPMPADGDAVFEIGSITKQFTAAALLLLVDDGLVDLDADFTRYVPGYDTRGRRITVRRLLDHTSGIKGYTEMAVFPDLAMRELPRDSLVELFEAEPLEFEPGTALIYNNSAYFLVGRIIERVSGQPYGQFVQERLFDPLGMSRSSYCDERDLTERKTHGYEPGPDGLRNKSYLDHLWPFAAGSLCSTPRDLLRWNGALHGGEVLPPDLYRDMVTPDLLADGTPIRYAMGIGTDLWDGRPVLAHGGGINGYLSDGMHMPDDDLTIVVLQNTAGPRGPGSLTTAIREAILGRPPPAATAGAYPGDPEILAGVYEGPGRGAALTVQVEVEDGRLVVTRVDPGPGQPTHPTWVGGTTWVDGTLRWSFVLDGAAVRELRMDGIGSHYVLRPTGPRGGGGDR